MKIALASDHGGYEFKELVKKHLQEQGYEIVDFGCNEKERCDYPDYGKPAAESVATGSADRGILICSTGIGMCMVANKVPGVRGGLVYNDHTAELTRRHNNTNVLCLGGLEFPHKDMLRWVDIWLTTPFDGGRHERRVEKVMSLQQTKESRC